MRGWDRYWVISMDIIIVMALIKLKGISTMNKELRVYKSFY